MECVIQMEATERTERRTAKIMWTGALLNFAMPLVIASLVYFLPLAVPSPTFWGLHTLLPALIPVGIGSLVAFLGMTLADSRQGVMEWGFCRPARCLLYGLAPYLLLLLGMSPRLMATSAGTAFLALVLTIAGGSLTAWLLSRAVSVRS